MRRERVVKTPGRVIERKRRQRETTDRAERRNQMATRRRMRYEAEEEIRGRSSPRKKGKEIADGEDEEQYQTV